MPQLVNANGKMRCRAVVMSPTTRGWVSYGRQCPNSSSQPCVTPMPLCMAHRRIYERGDILPFHRMDGGKGSLMLGIVT